LFSEREEDFVDDMMRFTSMGWEPTEKQAKWLKSIFARKPT
jgi:hypothetical protein